MAYPLVIPGYEGSTPGVQIGTQLAPDAGDEALRFTQQLGVEWVMTSLPDSEHTLENYRALKRRFADWGLKIYRLACHRCHNMEAVTLALPDRDRKVAEYLDYLRLLGRAGIHYATYAHMANGIWSTAPEPVRGGAMGRALRLDAEPVGHWIKDRWSGELTHGRRYTEAEIVQNFADFIGEVVPVAEDEGVVIGIHPDDPPVPDLGGIPRCLFGGIDGYRRALALADSPNVGVCLCVGCWLEGGPAMGCDVTAAIHEFGAAGKLFKVHLRNVDAPLPEGFVETLLDAGYQNMATVIRALVDVGFTGAMISDHLPSMVGGRYAAEAHAVGYMRGVLQAVAG